MSGNEFLSQMLLRGKKFLKTYGRAILRDVGVNMKSSTPKTYDVVFPGNISPMNFVPKHIVLPPYCSREEEEISEEISIKSNKEIESMRCSCSLAKEMLSAARSFAEVGVTTDELDRHIHQLIISRSAYPSPLNYNGFPKSICTSVNNVACHGIPDDRELKNGDIITVDVTVYYKNFHGDCAATFLIGNVDERGKKLVHAAEKALEKGISVCKPGQDFDEIAFAIEAEVRKHGFVVIPSICGHGIGQNFHEQPRIEHCFVGDIAEERLVMKPGMTFTIEPAIGEGSEAVQMLDDMWTLATDDDSRTAQFEHTVLITDSGVEILTE